MKQRRLNLAGVLAIVAALGLRGVTAFAQLTTFTNPEPAAADYFGHAVAAVGNDRVLIGAYWDNAGANNSGSAHLFDTNGTLIVTFANPTPAADDSFGWAIAAVGANRVLIGAYGDSAGVSGSGAAYLFSTNGALLTTFSNPTPGYRDYFGCAVAVLGTDRVLIGAYGDSTGASGAGAAYLFSTGGALLTTFTNPTPAAADRFGWSVAALGTDRVLVGAYQDDTGAYNAGAVYLFSTNGTLLTTLTNPAPEAGDCFGRSVAALGTDRVLVGADSDDLPGSFDAGAAYLFGTDGALLATFTKPEPAAQDYFGYSLTAVGTDRVLIGAYFDRTGADLTGAAYLFSTNGSLLGVIYNPTPDYNDEFGISVAALGTDRVLIGAWADDTGASDAGAAYLFSLEPYAPAPSLSITLRSQPTTLNISWPAPVEDWVLESTNALGGESESWPQVPPPYQADGGKLSVTFTNPPAGSLFFRLHRP